MRHNKILYGSCWYYNGRGLRAPDSRIDYNYYTVCLKSVVPHSGKNWIVLINRIASITVAYGLKNMCQTCCVQCWTSTKCFFFLSPSVRTSNIYLEGCRFQSSLLISRTNWNRSLFIVLILLACSFEERLER